MTVDHTRPRLHRATLANLVSVISAWMYTPDKQRMKPQQDCPALQVSAHLHLVVPTCRPSTHITAPVLALAQLICRGYFGGSECGGGRVEHALRSER
jgi:hypothetical protein